MKKHKHTLFVLTASLIGSLLTLTGCGGSDDSSSAVVAATPESLKSSTVAFNPTISFETGDNFTYDNSVQANSDLPTGTATGTFTEELSGDSLVITMTPIAGAWGDEQMTLTLSEFMDNENDGLIDSYTCAFKWGTVQGLEDGGFIGIPPANSDYKGELPDFKGAPTKEEWNKYIVGKWILDTEDGDDDGTTGAGQIVSATQMIESETETEDGYTSVEESVTNYEYKKTGETTGEITYTATETETYSGASYELKEAGTITLTFTDFFSAVYSTNYTETGPYKNGAPYDGYESYTGTETGKVELVAFEPKD